MKTARLLLLLAFAVGGGWTQCPHEASDLLAWEDPATWDSGVVPAAGDDVSISQPVLLSSATPALGSVTIPAGGRLVFAPVTSLVVQLSANMVELTGGQLWIGSEECPYETRADVVLTGRRDESPEAPSIQKAVLVRSGVLEVHGKPKRTWTKLAATLPKTTRTDILGSPIYDPKIDNPMTSQGIFMVEFDVEGKKVRNWGPINGVKKLQVAQRRPGNVVVFAVSGSVRFGRKEPVEEVLDALEALCYDGTRESALRGVENDQRAAWAAVCVIGSPSLSTERMGVTRNGRSATERLVHTIGNVDFVAHSVVSIDGAKPFILTEILSYSSGTVPSLDVTVSTLSDVSSWEVGDWIVAASTDFDQGQSEEFQLIDCPECDSSTFKITGPVLYTHWGEITDGIDMRGEVGVLTRNVRFYGIMEDSCYGSNLCDTFSYDTFGGQVKMLRGFDGARIENAEFFHMGQQPLLGSYPIHFHLCLDTSAKGVYVRSNSIHNSFSRCVTIHGTHNVTLQNNIGYHHLGHCYFLEDGGEQDNLIEGNLGLGTYPGTLVPTDQVGEVSTFWVTNPDNELINNVAAGSQGIGFWIFMPDFPKGPSADLDMGLVPGQILRTTVKAFRGNVAHSNPKFGFQLDELMLPDGTTGTLRYTARVDPTDPESAPIDMHFDDFIGYKNDQSVWIRTMYSTVTNYRIADSRIGVVLSSSGPGYRDDHRQILLNSRIVGNTANKGEPTTVKLDNGTTVQLDRSVDVWGSPLRARIGVAFYRGPVHVWNCTFARFKGNGVWPAGAVGKRPKNEYMSSPISGVRNVKFEFVDPAEGTRFFDGDGNSAGYREADGTRHNVIIDVDGSLTTYPGYSLVQPLPLLMNARCIRLPQWGPGTGLCPDRFTRVALKGAGLIPTFVTRNDLQASDVEVARANIQISYSLNTLESYILHFNTTVPQKFNVQPYGLYEGVAQVFGVCIGRDQSFHISPPDYTSVGSLAEVLADNTNTKYFYDSDIGVISFRFTNPYPRKEETTSHCTGELDEAGNGECAPGPRITLSESNDDGDCRARAYPAYATEPVSSEGRPTPPTFQ